MGCCEETAPSTTSASDTSAVSGFEQKNRELAKVLCAEEDGYTAASQMTLEELLYVFSMSGLQGLLSR